VILSLTPANSISEGTTIGACANVLNEAIKKMMIDAMYFITFIFSLKSLTHL